MRRLIPILAVLALILPPLAGVASAETVNHAAYFVNNTGSYYKGAYTVFEATRFYNFSARIFGINTGTSSYKIELFCDTTKFITITVDYENNAVKVDDNIIGAAASIIPNAWIYVYVNTTIARIAQYSTNISLNTQITKINFVVSPSNSIYFDDVMLNGEIIEDFEDANSIFAAETDSQLTIEEDPSPVIIHAPVWGGTVSVPFYINFTNPPNTSYNKIVVDYTELVTINDVNENVSFEFNIQDIPPGWHTFTVKAFDEYDNELGSASIYLYVVNDNYVPPEGDNSTASGNSGNSSGDSGSSSSTGGSTGSSGSAGDTGDSGFTEFADDVKGWFTEETLNIPRWIWIVALLGVLLIGHGVRRL